MVVPGTSLNLPSMRVWLSEGQPRWLSALEELVRCESPSGDWEALRACASIAEAWFGREAGLSDSQLVIDQNVPSLRLRSKQSQGEPVLLLGHLDTVWEKGAFQPLFEVSGARVQGPGVFDMKGGAVVALAALAGLRESGVALGPLTVLLTGDEEVGSSTSRALIEAEARRHRAVLVLEPPVGDSVKVARKGTGGYAVTVYGRAAHAGLEPDKGINAVVEIAPLVAQIAALARPELGTTVSPTVLRGGTRTNVIPARAHLEVDVRFSSAAEADRIEMEIRRLGVSHPGARLEIKGGANRPPFEPQLSASLFGLARRVAAELGWAGLDGAAVGGGSDGNFTAALGIPTLDGMGIVGGNAHAEGEWALTDSLPDRAALLAGCVLGIWGGQLT